MAQRRFGIRSERVRGPFPALGVTLTSLVLAVAVDGPSGVALAWGYTTRLNTLSKVHLMFAAQRSTSCTDTPGVDKLLPSTFDLLRAREHHNALLHALRIVVCQGHTGP